MASVDLGEIIRVLHVDDDSNQLKYTKLFLERADEKIRIDSASSPQGALEALQRGDYDCILSDYLMPEMDGVELAKTVKERSDVPYILYTGQGSEEVAEKAFDIGIDDYFRKEYDLNHYQILAKRIRITVEKHRAERDLHRSEENYRNVVESAHLGIVVTQDGILKFVNPMTVSMFGYEEEELLGRHFGEFVYNEDRESAVQRYSKRIKDGVDTDYFQLRIVTKFQEIRWIETSGLRTDWDDKPAVLHFLTDITVQKAANESVREKEEMFRNLAEQSPNMIFINKRGKVVYANKQCEEVMGYTREEYYSPEFDFMKLIAPESRDLVIEKYGHHLTGEEVSSYEYALLTKNGRRLDSIISTKLINYDGEACILGIITDITDRKRMEQELRESEEKYRQLIELAPDGIVTVDLEGFVTSINPTVAKATGYSKDEIVCQHVSKLGFLVPRDIPTYLKIFSSLLSGKLPEPFEVQYRKSNGVLSWGEVHLSYIVENGEKVGIQAITRNILERVHRKEESLRYEERLEALHRHAYELAESEDAMEIAEKTFNAIEQLLGFDLGSFALREGDAIRFIYVKGLDVEKDYELPLDGRSIINRAIRTGETQLIPDVRLDKEYHPGRTKGYYKVLSELTVPIRVGRGIIGAINVESEKRSAFTDTDKKLLEILSQHVGSALSRIKHLEMLQSSEERYRRYLDSSKDAIFVIDNEKYLYANNAAAALLKYDNPEELIGKKAFEHIVSEDREMVRTMAVRRQRGEEAPNRYRFRLVCSDGEVKDVEVNVSLIEYEGRPASLSVNRDITEQKRMEKELKDANEALNERVKELTCLFEAIKAMQKVRSYDELCPNIVRILTNGMRYPEISVPVIEINGDKFINNRYSENLTHGLHAKMKSQGREVGRVSVYYTEERQFILPEEQMMLDALGESLVRWYEGVEAANTLLDYTERLEEAVEEKTRELLDAERMITAGRVAAMVGHDLRGPLQIIKNAVYLMKRAPQNNSEMLEMIEDSVERANDMIEEFRSRTRDSPLMIGPLDLVELVRTALEEVFLTASIEVTHRLDDSLHRVFLDATKMHRIMDNLIQNAVEAMPKGGKLEVEARREGDQVVISVSDTGVGIRDSELQKLFKPFQTTKNGGLGLGLYYCKRAVEAQRGRISVESKFGEGSTFTVTLPILGEHDVPTGSMTKVEFPIV